MFSIYQFRKCSYIQFPSNAFDDSVHVRVIMKRYVLPFSDDEYPHGNVLVLHDRYVGYWSSIDLSVSGGTRIED